MIDRIIKILIIVVVAMLLADGMAWGQTCNYSEYTQNTNVTLGTAETSNLAIFYAAPVCIYNGSNYKYSRTQMIFTKSELNALGINKGYINSISFEYSASGSQTFSSINVQCGHTGLETFPSYSNCWQTSGLTTVYNTSYTFEGTGGDSNFAWRTITFSTPFLWNGEDNLLVYILNNSGTQPSVSGYFRYTDYGVRKMILGYGDTQGNSYYNGSTNNPGNKRPNVKFNMCVPPTPCPEPSDVVATAGDTYAYVTWTETGTATQWKVIYGYYGFNRDNAVENGSDLSTGIKVTTSDMPYRINGLTADRTYQVYVMAMCDANNTSIRIGDTFNTVSTTTCGGNYNRGVTATVGNIPPSGFTTTNIIDHSYNSNYYSYSMHIYTREELAALGLNAGTINSMSILYMKSGFSTVPRKITVYMGHTSSSTTTTTSGAWCATSAALTQVYYNADFGFPEVTDYGWLDFEFDTPFEYNGTDNLVVAIHKDSKSTYLETYQPTFGYTTTTGNRTAYYRSSSQFSLNANKIPAQTATCNNQRMNVKFNCCSTCPSSPAQNTFTNTGSANCPNYTISWSPITGASYYEVRENNSLLANVVEPSYTSSASGTHNFVIRSIVPMCTMSDVQYQFSYPCCTAIPVTGLSVANRDRECVVTWTAEGATSCEIYYGVTNPPTDGWNVNATSPFTALRLTNGRTYYFMVKPIGDGTTYCTDNDPSDPVAGHPNCTQP